MRAGSPDTWSVRTCRFLLPALLSADAAERSKTEMVAVEYGSYMAE